MSIQIIRPEIGNKAEIAPLCDWLYSIRKFSSVFRGWYEEYCRNGKSLPLYEWVPSSGNPPKLLPSNEIASQWKAVYDLFSEAQTDPNTFDEMLARARDEGDVYLSVQDIDAFCNAVGIPFPVRQSAAQVENIGQKKKGKKR
jgi:hypothetical protein